MSIVTHRDGKAYLERNMIKTVINGREHEVMVITEDEAKGVIMAIRDGVIPAVSIDYQWQG